MSRRSEAEIAADGGRELKNPRSESAIRADLRKQLEAMELRYRAWLVSGTNTTTIGASNVQR